MTTILPIITLLINVAILGSIFFVNSSLSSILFKLKLMNEDIRAIDRLVTPLGAPPQPAPPSKDAPAHVNRVPRNPRAHISWQEMRKNLEEKSAMKE